MFDIHFAVKWRYVLLHETVSASQALCINKRRRCYTSCLMKTLC